MQQLSLFPGIEKKQIELTRDTFSHNGVCAEKARIALEENYGSLLEETDLA
jgi:hypothetical protein